MQGPPLTPRVCDVLHAEGDCATSGRARHTSTAAAAATRCCAAQPVGHPWPHPCTHLCSSSCSRQRQPPLARCRNSTCCRGGVWSPPGGCDAVTRPQPHPATAGLLPHQPGGAAAAAGGAAGHGTREGAAGGWVSGGGGGGGGRRCGVCCAWLGVGLCPGGGGCMCSWMLGYLLLCNGHSVWDRLCTRAIAHTGCLYA
jgi:hypothetical protein